MNKIGYIIGREYMVRVRKRTFWILTFLIPVLYGLMIGFSVLMTKNPGIKLQEVNVIDYSELFKDKLSDNDDINYVFMEKGTEQGLIKMLETAENQHVLVFPVLDVNKPEGIKLYSTKQAATVTSDKIKADIKNIIKDERIKALGLTQEVIAQLEPDIKLDIKKISEEGIEDDNTLLSGIVAGIAGFLNYIFVFIYGSLVLRGVHEEKQSRIVEIIISTVRPFELMLGKIIGVALVGLTQFIMWIGIIAIISTAGIADLSMIAGNNTGSSELSSILSGLSNINFPLIIATFIFYFIGGYFLYSSLFAAVAASVDNQTDMQQFIVPLSIPLIIAIISIQGILQAPNSDLAVWMSMIPFTSPVIMVARVSFGIPYSQLIISMILMAATFIFATWIAGKIYRVGILMTGVKVTYKQLWKWIFYK